ncbi:S41 family peptidase [Dyadobacter sp. CY323]|uniref:S41 family peptidase n=1 Tax=Dyadobacter sp. CY323 TaxID=2907302 RepID=UPI001F3AF082|nr:S41 family peptidase [Dyadobacter sp. CY323]MCE6992200.1 S41 family peptidase [Dyadobacter sp. CY323]
MNSKILIICLFVLFYECAAQPLPPGKISREAALNDLVIIRKSIEDVHPGLNRFGQEAGFKVTYDSIRHVIESQDSIALVALFRTVNPLFVKVKCGHLKFLPPQKDFPFYYHQENVLPVIVRFDEQMRLLIVKSVDPAFVGEYIDSINGRSIASILDILRANMFVDGDIMASANAQIQQYFSAWYADFIQENGSFELVLKNSSGINKQVNMAGITTENWKKLNVSFKDLSVENTLTFKSDSVAYLRIAHFYSTTNKAFVKFLDDSFNAIDKKPVKHLIIDVRGNEGGNDRLGKDLYARIARNDFKYYDHIEVAARRKKDVTYREMAYIPRFAGLATFFIKKQKDGRLLFRKHQNLGNHRPKKNAYKGEVSFLVDGLSYSVTSEFLAVAKNESRGKFIGTESGGGYSGDNSGTFVIFKLPASKFDVGLPVAAYYSAVKPPQTPARGIMPDVQVLPTASDLLNEEDTILNFAMH